MKTEVTHETDLALRTLSKAINDRETTIAQLKLRTVDTANQTIAEAMLQGQDLIRAKAIIPHGLWLDWLAAHCPNISQQTASVYMRIASNYQRASSLDDVGSIRQALAMLMDKGGEPASEPKRWPAPIEGVRRLSLVMDYWTRTKFVEWPEENKDAARDVLLPAARQLWPDRFA
jgi:hypothetical protein